MTEPLLTVERGDDGVALLTLRNGKVNALSSELLRQLADAAEALAADPPGAVVITGSERIFAAGAEISEFGGTEKGREVGGHFLRAMNAVAAIPRMTIAAVAGPALGGGCELALACDLRIAAEGAKFGQPEVLLGIIPGGGGTQRLARLVGPARAKAMIMGGRQVRSAEALAMGLVDEVVPNDELLERARTVAAGYARGAVLAQAMIKRAIDEGLELPIDEGLALEQDLFEEVFGTDDADTGLRSFLENGPGKATFSGR
jgi:enoyl-CoA hydratase